MIDELHGLLGKTIGVWLNHTPAAHEPDYVGEVVGYFDHPSITLRRADGQEVTVSSELRRAVMTQMPEQATPKPWPTLREITEQVDAIAQQAMRDAGMPSPLYRAPAEARDPASVADLDAGLALQAPLDGPSVDADGPARPAEGTGQDEAPAGAEGLATGGVVTGGLPATIGGFVYENPEVLFVPRMTEEEAEKVRQGILRQVGFGLISGRRIQFTDAEAPTAERDELRRKVAAVRALHQQYRDVYATEETGDSCAHCNGFTDAWRVPWPCPTIQALDGEQ